MWHRCLRASLLVVTLLSLPSSLLLDLRLSVRGPEPAYTPSLQRRHPVPLHLQPPASAISRSWPSSIIMDFCSALDNTIIPHQDFLSFASSRSLRHRQSVYWSHPSMPSSSPRSASSGLTFDLPPPALTLFAVPHASPSVSAPPDSSCRIPLPHQLPPSTPFPSIRSGLVVDTYFILQFMHTHV